MGLNRLTAVAVAIVVVVAGIAAFAMMGQEDDDTIRIGVLPVIDTLPLIVADEYGIFSDQGVDVELVRFNSAQERDSAFIAGNIDGYFGDPLIATLMERSGEDITMVTVDYHTTVGHMMFGLLSSPGSDIRSFEDIGDEQVAISEGSVIEYFLDEMAIAEGHNGTVGKVAVASIPVRYQSLLQGNVELALLPEPLATMAIAEGAHLICDDGGIDTTATVITMRSSYVDSNMFRMGAFLDAYAESVRRITDSPSEYMGLLVEHANFPEDLVDGYDLQPMSSPSLVPESDIDRLQSWMVDKGMLTEPLAYGELVCEGLYA